MKNKKGFILFFCITFFVFFFKSEVAYFYELVSTIVKIQRTEADITDYKYFSNIEIPKSKNPQPWPIHKKYNQTPTTKALDSLHDNYGTVAFLIINKDSIWHEKYYRGYNERSYSNSFSMSKSMVTAVMGKAIEKGFFSSMDDKVGDFIDNYDKGFASKLTIGDLSSMSSGMKWTENYTNIFGVTARAYVGSNLNELILSRPIIKQPGVEFEYLSSDTQLLSITIEKATGKKVSELLYDWFLDPMGTENGALWQVDNVKTNSEKAYCCFNSNARDFARFGKLFKNEGKWGNLKLLDSEFVRKVLKPRFKNSPEYGYGFWLGEYNQKKFFSMRGHLGQYVIVFPAEDVIIVRLGQMHDKKSENEKFTDDFYYYISESFKMLNI